ncbi:hypothetical protein KUCAC02_026685, partial [Chaenocephalus aceratus]
EDIDAGRECLIKGLCIYLNEDPEDLVKEYMEDIDAGRECLIKGLCIYLNEDPEDLVKEYMVSVC